MTDFLDEKVEFLQDLIKTCEDFKEKLKKECKYKAHIKLSKPMFDIVGEYQADFENELEPLEQEQSYYADKYRPTEADL